MTRFEAGDVVRVLFPHVESNVRRSRPALVLTREPVGPDGSLIWVAMITNARRKPWLGDVLIDDHKAVGLPVPSVVRTAKVATLEAASANRIGRLEDAQIEAIRKRVLGYLGG
jgi:mRNA-degrading endonuclease toxin of MazEF toxin-antitoxin module